MQRDQSIAFAVRSLASKTSCKRCQTPASCQVRSRRQQLMPEPQPISLGSISQGMPDCNTNRMPVSTTRSSSGLRPGYLVRRAFGGGNNGAISPHNSSSSIVLAISSAQKTEQRLTNFDHCEQGVTLILLEALSASCLWGHRTMAAWRFHPRETPNKYRKQ